MRRALILAVISLTLPIAAWADGIDLFNHFGTVSISDAGVFSKGSQLSQYQAINAGHSLGSVSFGTGALLSGSIQAGGTFSDVGSFFNVVGKGIAGQPKGAIFTQRGLREALGTQEIGELGDSLVKAKENAPDR
jgi:hypothetical protein